MIRQFFLAGTAGIICLFSLLAGSGIGQTYGLYAKTEIVVIIVYTAVILSRVLSTRMVRRRNFVIFACLVVVVGIWPIVQGHKLMGVNYGWLLLLPYLVGIFSFTRLNIKVMSAACMAFGFAVLVAKIYFGIFAHWNPNDIAMVGFLCCAVFTVAPWQNWYERLIERVSLIIMSLLILQMGSRSCFFGVLVLALFVFDILKSEQLLRYKWLRNIVLIMPALIAVFVVLFQNAEIFDSLNDLSLQHFGKPIFNGRNDAWEDGLSLVMEHFWLGTGYIDNGRWHNCAVSCLTAFGVLGYVAWIGYFDNILSETVTWRKDVCLCNCVAAFLVVMLQQSFELGLISTTGNMLPYFLLGILLGRVRYLKKQQRIYG